MSTDTARAERLRDHFRGTLIGVPLGDALGRPVEGMPADAIRRAHGHGASPAEAIETLGVGGRASESVPAALWAFVSRSDDAEEAIVRAVHLGGDADTIAVMTEAIAGGYHGLSELPARWVEALEDGPKGRAYVPDLANRLAALHG